MPLGLVVPILAQVFTVAVGDRAEVRWVANQTDDYYEFEDRALVAASLAGKDSRVGLFYSPSVIVTPLEESSRSDNYFHHVGLDASLDFRTSRRSTYRLSQTAAYDRADVRLQALSGNNALPGGPPTTGVNPPPGSTGAGPNATSAAVNSSQFTTEIVSVRTQLSNDYRLTRRGTLQSFIAYSGSSGVGDSRAQFPLIQGPDGTVAYRYQLGRRDDLTTSLIGRYTFASTGDRAFVLSLDEGWGHTFSRYASMRIGAAVTYVYFDPDDGPATEDIFFGAGAGGQLGVTFTSTSKWAGGRLTLFVGAAYAPVLDQSRLGVTGQQQRALTPDVRIAVFTGATWTRRRLTLYANASTIVSAEPEDTGAVNSIGAAIGSIYDLGAGFAFEAGARAAYQTLEGVELLQPSLAAFVALSWGATVLETH